MAETEIQKTTDADQSQPQPGVAFQRYYDSIQVACDPPPPLWPNNETPEAAEAREAQGLPPPRPFQHTPYDHSRKEAAAAGPHRQGYAQRGEAVHRPEDAERREREKAEAAKREAEAHKAATARR
jgi:hypothetical protein